MSNNNFEFSPAKIEEKILEFWKEKEIFKKSLKENKSKSYIFYDGPPFANGLPHYGHILASIIKDVIPRYKAMKGYFVPRRWGWDCHGLPVEHSVEQQLGIKTKKDIEKFGVEKFNQEAKKDVLKYSDEWKKIIPRIGRWVDMENDYRTMDTSYTESVWWIFKKLYDKKLIYEGYKSMHICPRCETTLANFEVAQGYKDISDLSATVKFELIDEPGTYLLAWTTTPWTLPGNVALAVNPNIDYAEIRIMNNESGIMEKFIVAEIKVNDIFGNKEYKIVRKFKGKELIGKKYNPLFDYYFENKNLKNKENGWRIYGADFVSSEEGTGIVHIAPAFGEEDMELMKKYDLPFVQHVSMDGRFKEEVKDFAGLPVKPKGNHKETDKKIVDFLNDQGKLFNKVEFVHSYPHCWRCDTPLLNYAANSWFVKVTAFKNKLLANNKKINWIPAHIKEGRFGKWIADVRDWAISRLRFWGAPLPVWKCDKCGEIKVIGSLAELIKSWKKSGNNYYILRHGQSETQILGVADDSINAYHLTGEGKKQVEKAADKLKKISHKGIDLIFSSDVLRTKETSQIIASKLAVKEIIFDKRIREIHIGIFENQPCNLYRRYYSSEKEKFIKRPPQGENLNDLKRRMMDFMLEIESKYKNKNILIVSHEYPLWILFGASQGLNNDEILALRDDGEKTDFIKTGELMKIDFNLFPYNRDFEIDLHKPYIDNVNFDCSCGGLMERIKDVFDCWFESGSMPFAQAHYPFENKKDFGKKFPAEFIAEGLDQTRGWFYTMLVLSTALFNKPAYKNVLVSGIILAENGQKMSKRLKNYPDPMTIVEKYGADALRYYLLSSQAVRAESLNFSEKGVDEIYKKLISRLYNVYKFYELYADKELLNVKSKSLNALDQWILAKLKLLIKEVSDGLENYELDRAARPIEQFIEDLSTWYIRRSRGRFKDGGIDAQNSVATTKFVLLELSKIMSPFTPFIAEKIYQTVGGKKESVHLEEWPKIDLRLTANDLRLIEMMIEVRILVSLALEAREKAGIKVKQPLLKLKVKSQKLKVKNNEELLKILAEEINVKKIDFDENIKEEILLDTKITPELKEEGLLRELIRLIQGMRKDGALVTKDVIILKYSGEIAVFEKFTDILKKEINAQKIEKGIPEKEVFLIKREAEIEKGNKIYLAIKKN